MDTIQLQVRLLNNSRNLKYVNVKAVENYCRKVNFMKVEVECIDIAVVITGKVVFWPR